jgi:nucleoside transporter
MRTRTRLAVMMALAYAVQGAWWPLLSVHLADLRVSERERGLIFATLAMAAIFAPALAGRIADRMLSAQKLLAILFGLGVLFLLALAVGVTTTFSGLFPLFLAYWFVMIPYLNLTNAVAMRNLKQPEEEYGGIRMWGTVGWMVVSWLVAATMTWTGGHTSTAFLIAAALACSMVLVSLRLPDTPPLATSARGLPIREALELLKKPGVSALLAAGFLVSLTTPFVYQSVPLYLRHIGLGRPSIAASMSLGQIPEIVLLSSLPLILHRMGRKTTMVLGIVAWVFYHGLFASNPGILVARLAIPLNGLAIALFHVTGPMYLDSQAPPDRRAGTQGLWVMTTSGLGSLVGGLLAGEVMRFAAGNWRIVFMVPACIAGFAACLLLFAFREARNGARISAIPVWSPEPSSDPRARLVQLDR